MHSRAPWIIALAMGCSSASSFEKTSVLIHGSWRAIPGERGGLSRVWIGNVKGTWYAHIWAFATRDEIDWGRRPVTLFARDVLSKNYDVGTTTWETEFGRDLVTLRRVGKTLEVETFTTFTDRSGRSAYHSVQRLVRR